MHPLYNKDPQKSTALERSAKKNTGGLNMSTYDFSTLYTTLPHNFIKDKLIDLIEREDSPYLACKDINAFFTSDFFLKIMV